MALTATRCTRCGGTVGTTMTLDGLERACVACGASTKRDEDRRLAEMNAALDSRRVGPSGQRRPARAGRGTYTNV